MKRILLFSFLVLLVSQITVLNSGCANIIPPQGGPKDSIPPQLIKATPGDSARNFTGNKISFSFNEFIDVQNVQENLRLSPVPKINPIIEFKLNTMTVKLKDSLDANTTYTLNFREAIKDFTEGNILKGFTYVFSTGPYLDSMEVTGKVIMAETGKADSTLIVMLHTSADDSVVVKDKPRYVTQLDNKGNFVFKNLPAKTFYLYALKDEGGTYRYYSDKTIFAFASKPINTQLKNDSITLYAYAAQPAQQSATAPATGKNKPDKDTRLKYQTSLTGDQLDLLSNFSMTFDTPLKTFNSSKIKLTSDTTFIPVTGYKFEKDSLNKKIQLVNAWKENTVYNLIMEKDFAEDSFGKKLLKTDTLTFKTKKLADYGSLKLRFRNLDTTKHPVLFFVLNDGVVKTHVFGNSTDFSQAIFLPGEYELRILFDENKNGKWDPGEFFGKHKQPEIVKPLERKITVKAGGQNEFDLSL